jgi:hypothetical protein
VTDHQQAVMEVEAEIGIAGEAVASTTVIVADTEEWTVVHMAVMAIRADMAAVVDMITIVAVTMAAAAVTIRVNIQAVNHIKVIEVTIIKLIKLIETQ